MRRLSGYLLAAFVALVLPSLAYAQAGVDQPFSGMWQLSPPATDASVYFLGQLFGSVGGVLGSAGSQVMGHIFKAFNYGLILVAGSMLAYTVFMSVLNTANDGQFMGQEKKGAWVILRSVGGISFLVPQASGYCFAQIFVMWAVLQGVGLADIAWGRVLDYLETGGSVYVQASPDATPSLSGSSGLDTMLGQVMQSGVCLQGVAKAVNGAYDKQLAVARASGSPIPAKTSLAWGAYVDNVDTDSATLRFGVSDPESPLSRICGEYNLLGHRDESGVGSQQLSYIKVAALELYNSQIVLASLLNSPSMSGLNCLTKPDDAACNAMVNTVANMAMNFQNLMRPVLTDLNNKKLVDARGKLEDARNYGWIMAGSYYYTFSALQQQAQAMTKVSNYIGLHGDPTKFPDYKNIQKQVGYQTGLTISTKAVRDANTLFTTNFVYLTTTIDKTLKARADYNQQSLDAEATSTKGAEKTYKHGKHKGDVKTYKHGKNKGDTKYQKSGLDKTKQGLKAVAIVGGGPIGAVVLPMMFNRIEELVDKWNTAFAPGNVSQQDPILKVSQFGRDMVTTGVKIWMKSSALIFGISVALSIMTSITGVGAGLASSAKMFTPIVIAVVVALIVNGVVLSVYIPLIPFLLFFFTAVGWMMSVVEAIVAAPLVALGVTHPEGHDLLGKSEQSLMLLLSVFIKPIAMLIGFFAAIIITRVGIEMLNMGIGNALSVSGFQNKTDIFTTLGFMMIYTLILIGLINFSFALIHLLPDKIMRWLGTSPDSFGGEQQMAAIKGGLSSGMQKIAKSGADSTITSADFADKAGQAASSSNSGDKKGPEASQGEGKGGTGEATAGTP